MDLSGSPSLVFTSFYNSASLSETSTCLSTEIVTATSFGDIEVIFDGKGTIESTFIAITGLLPGYT